MPMHEQILRKEQDPFHKEEGQNQTALEQAAAVRQQRVEAEERLVTAGEPTAQEALAPSVMAHLPGQTGASDEAVKQLFNHFSERERKGGQSAEEEAQQNTATQTDPRTSAKSKDPNGSLDRKAGDEFTEGFAADFMPDSQFVGADLDDRPRAEGADVWDGTSSPRRRRRGSTAAPAVKKSKGEGKP
jgi:hypothetical protein